MNEFLLVHATVAETGSVANHITTASKKFDWTNDTYLTGMLDKNETNTILLLDTTGTVRKQKFTQDLLSTDEIFNRRYLYTKNLVEAHTYSSDEAVAKSATEVLLKIEANNPELYRMGYGDQIFMCRSLLSDLGKPEMKVHVDVLPGVPDSLLKLDEINEQLDGIYSESKKNRSSIEKLLPPSEQRNVVRDYLNDELLPYISVMAKKEPATYAEFAKEVFQHIADANQKIRTRIRLKSNEKEITEEQNN